MTEGRLVTLDCEEPPWRFDKERYSGSREDREGEPMNAPRSTESSS